jgi:hypothetical protein
MKWAIVDAGRGEKKKLRNVFGFRRRRWAKTSMLAEIGN